MRYISVCSGVEAASLAWAHMGWKPVAFSEIEPFPSAVLAHRFPDGWTQIPWKGRPAEQCPDAPRYKACGNSMCVNVMRWIGERIEEFSNKEK